MSSDTAVIILNYNTWADSLTEADMVHDVCGIEYGDIIIVDNCSPNESEEKLRENASKGYVFIKAEKNGGYAAGNNIGLSYACEKGYKYAWILNNDIIIDDAGLSDKLRTVMERDETVAAVNPDIYAPDGHLFNRDAKRPSFGDLTVGMIAYKKSGRAIKDIGGYGYIYRPQGCCMMLSLKAMSEIGFFDESTFLYYEEIILAERLRNKNLRCACALNARVVHNHSNTVKSTFEKKKIIKIQQESFEYYLKNYRNFGYVKRKLCKLFNLLKLIILK